MTRDEIISDVPQDFIPAGAEAVAAFDPETGASVTGFFDPETGVTTIQRFALHGAATDGGSAKGGEA